MEHVAPFSKTKGDGEMFRKNCGHLKPPLIPDIGS